MFYSSDVKPTKSVYSKVLHQLFMSFIFSYEFVRQLRSRINTALLPVVANEMEKRAVGGVDCTNAIPLIIEELLVSQE